MTKVGLTVYFEREALLSPDGYLFQPDRSRPRFPTDRLEAIDWTGINIRKESQGPHCDGILIAQQSLCRKAMSTDQAELLGCTELYLSEPTAHDSGFSAASSWTAT
jgi:hypothetical protein